MIDLELPLGHHPISRQITIERAAKYGFALQPLHVDPIHDAFSPMIREDLYDASELAIVSAIQAFSHDKPLMLLPVTLAARLQHKCIVRDNRRAAFGPEDLRGKRVGVRAYTQTTGAWVRTILQTQYGIHPQDIHWVTQTGAHVVEFQDPDFVVHADKSKSLLDMLAAGEIDAAIFGNDLPDLPWISPVISEPEVAGLESVSKSGVVPINHVLAVSLHYVQAYPKAPAALMALFREAKATADPADGPDLFPIGLQAMRSSVTALLGSAYDQGLIPRPISVDDLFSPATVALGQLAD